MATTLCRRPPDTVAVPISKQHWCKQKVQCSRLSCTAACQDTLPHRRHQKTRDIAQKQAHVLQLSDSALVHNTTIQCITQENANVEACAESSAVGYLMLMCAKTLFFTKASNDRKCSTEASTCAAGYLMLLRCPRTHSTCTEAITGADIPEVLSP